MKKTLLAAMALALTGTAPAWAANTYALQTVGSNFSNPIFATYAPGDANHLYILERAVLSGVSSTTGEIRILDLTTHQSSVFLDIPNVYTDGEEGALGLAFDPNYASNGKFYVNISTAPTTGNMGVQNIIEYHRQTATTANTTPDGKLLSWANMVSLSHKAGWIGFSPQVDPLNPGTTIRANDDHNLYIATGDGSYPLVDGGGFGQSKTTLLAKILRIHVDPNTATYSIPSNNPLAGSVNPSEKKEIFAYGLRNPFRDSFDRATGALYIGDVGLDSREEVDYETITSPTLAPNFEWSYREGNIQTPGSTGGPLTNAPNEVGPILDYGHSTVVDPSLPSLIGQCIIGGYVYRGSAMPELDGTYFFGDLLAGRVYSFNYDGTTVTNLTDWTSRIGPVAGVVSFGEDATGELYIISQANTSGSLQSGNGTVFKLIATPEPGTCLASLLGAGLLLGRRRRRSH